LIGTKIGDLEWP